jgi:hypothetical protein
MAAFQLGHINHAWDPFFGAGSELIVTSEVSEAWPVADAGVGATVYVLKIVSGIIGENLSPQSKTTTVPGTGGYLSVYPWVVMGTSRELLRELLF